MIEFFTRAKKDSRDSLRSTSRRPLELALDEIIRERLQLVLGFRGRKDGVDVFRKSRRGRVFLGGRDEERTWRGGRKKNGRKRIKESSLW